jgi:hypothetical protein
MELKEAVERLLEIRDRHSKNVKMLEESKVYLKNTAFEDVLIERKKDIEVIDTVLTELDRLKDENEGMDEWYTKGYQEGYIAGSMELI